MSAPTPLETQFLALVNDARDDAGIAPLVLDGELIDAARLHSQDMEARDFFAHTNPDGESPGDRIAEAGYGALGWGENVAWASDRGADGLDLADVQVLFDNLWASDGHRANMLGPNTETGVGLAFGDMPTDGGEFEAAFVTQVFGTPTAAEAAEPDDVAPPPVEEPPPEEPPPEEPPPEEPPPEEPPAEEPPEEPPAEEPPAVGWDEQAALVTAYHAATGRWVAYADIPDGFVPDDPGPPLGTPPDEPGPVVTLDWATIAALVEAHHAATGRWVPYEDLLVPDVAPPPPSAVDWNAVAAEVNANFEATGSWFA